MEINSSLPMTDTLSLAEAGVLDLMSFTFPANDPQDKKVRSACVTAEFCRILRGRLSPAETNLWSLLERSAEGGIDATEGARLLDKFDIVLIEQAATLGWRMYESVVVLARIALWSDRTDDGVDKLARFQSAIIRNAELKRGLAQHPFTEPEWYATRKAALKAVKVLRKELHSRFRIRKTHRPPNLSELYREIRSTIAGNIRSYGHLMANLTSFMSYLEREDSPSNTVTLLTTRFVTGQVTPASIVNGWFDYQGCTANGKSRQIISRIGSQKLR